jgi:hypothetical protein
MTFSVLASGWLFVTPMLWGHRGPEAAVAMLIGVVGLVLSPLLIVRSRARPILAVAGGVLLLSSFVLSDALITTLDNLLIGVVLLIAGLAADAPPKRQVEYAPLH